MEIPIVFLFFVPILAELNPITAISTIQSNSDGYHQMHNLSSLKINASDHNEIPSDQASVRYDSNSNNNNNQNNNETLLIKSIRRFQPSNRTKKNLYPSILIENSQENNLINEELLNDLNKFGAYSKLISQLMNSIMNKELGSSTMQKKLDQIKTKITSIKFETILDNIADKMIKKIEDVHSAIEITGERIQEIFHKYLESNLTINYLRCCDFYDDKSQFRMDEFLRSYNLNGEYDAKLFNEIKSKEQEVKNENYRLDKRFNTWINQQYACDIEDDNRDPSHFNPSGPNLINQFKTNLIQNPSIKWQYFTSLLGIHTEYPSYLPPNNYCFLRNFVNRYENNKPSKSNIENKKYTLSNEFAKRFGKFKNKKQDLFYHHRKAYTELNQFFSQRHRENLLTSALPRNKLVIIVIDRGSALTDRQLFLAKSTAKYILNSLSHGDKVGIISLSSDVHFPSSEICSSNFELSYANYETKHFYGRHIEDLERSYNSTNHHLGFKKAFEVISSNYFAFKNQIGSDPEIFIAYISRGLLASLADAKPVMQLISDELKKSPYSFVINTYALIDERIPILLETIFLREIASMNFRKFNVIAPEQNKIQPGIMIALNNTEDLSIVLNGIYASLTDSLYESNNILYLSLPHFDFISKDTLISLSKAFHYQDHLIGVVGIDLSFFDLAEDIIHYDYPDSYAFLMDAHSGKLLYHPVFEHYFHTNFRQQNKFNPYTNYNYYFQNSFINVEHIEQLDGFISEVKQLIMTESNGKHSIIINNHRMSKINDSNWWNDQAHLLAKYSTITYQWRRIPSSPYVVVIATYGQKRQEMPFDEEVSFKKQLVFEPNQTSKFVSHRLDYNNKQSPKLCKHFNQLATTERATLFLSPNSFMDHYKIEMDGDSYETNRRYMAYINDKTQTVNNPGLKPNVRPDVDALNFLSEFWKNTFETSSTSKYIVRKYIATFSGAFLVYPGSLIDQSFQPKTRPWFSRAISNPDKMIFIPPYMDIGGSGYIVTIAQAIQEGNPNGTHTSNDNIWAVMAIDMTLGYFHKIIDEMVPICTQKKSSCFLMDNYGYLIVHSSFWKPSLMPFFERQHITHKEPHMMNHLFSHKNFVTKLVCNSYTDRTIQRFYMFNTSISGIVTNIVKTNANTSCAKYNMVSLDGTNAFFGIVDHSCDNFTTFCPCSLTDHLCLNCHRMEQTDCECPCECPLMMNLCNGRLIETEDQHPICTESSDKIKAPSVPSHLFETLDTCVNSECSNKRSESECKGIVGCEWCSMENGLSLKKPFCTNQNLCFGGIYGSKNPYMTNFYLLNHENHKPIPNPPIGFLTATLMLCFVILTFSLYCFHYQSNRNMNSRYLGSNNNEHQILQTPNDIDINDNEPSGNDNMEAISSFLQAPIVSNYGNLVSPYQYNSNYRRGAESDYGYSTMTPNDDSELNGPIYINPDIIRTNKKNSNNKNDAGSIVSSSNVESSSVISCPSTSSLSESTNRLPPPPSKIGSSKNRSKQKFNDNLMKENNLKSRTLLSVVDEKCLDDNNTIYVN